MKILLVGATGAVGRLLLPLLVEAGHEVTGTTRRASKSEQIEALAGQPVVVDALDREAMFTTLSAAQTLTSRLPNSNAKPAKTSWFLAAAHSGTTCWLMIWWTNST